MNGNSSHASKSFNDIILNGNQRNNSRFVKKKWRPMSYAESTLNPLSSSLSFPINSFYNATNDKCLEIESGSNKLFNGYSIEDLEFRLNRLRQKQQQSERRKSICVDFAISCVEPNPTCFSMEQV